MTPVDTAGVGLERSRGRFVVQAPAIERFWDKVSPEPNSGCWLWVGARDMDGYGIFFENAKSCRAHRWSYEHFVGTIPGGLQIDHKCRVCSCVNPEHLRPVTNRQNSLLGVGITAVNAAKTHCQWGHEFTERNTRWRFEDGFNVRQCRECDRLRWYRRTGRPEIAAQEDGNG